MNARLLLLIWVWMGTAVCAVAQNVNTEFGKNRIQYHEFKWWQYESDNFIVYWYKEGREIGQSVVQLAELDHEEIRSLMEYRITDKIEILVYTDLTDIKQSNIGKDEVFMSSNGMTKIVDNKMFVYFDGDHNHLRRQIREGIARIYLNYMMYGGNFQEIVQNAVLLNLPEWFTEGLVAYVGQSWDTDLDYQLRDGLVSGKYESFQDLVDDDPRLAGHSFWYFIAQNFGKATISNLLYLTRINRSVDNGFLYVMGTDFYRISVSWYVFFKQQYSQSEALGEPLAEASAIPLRNRRNVPITQSQISPDGSRVAYVTNEIGKTRVYVQNLDGSNRQVILKNGYKNLFQATDYNYPLLTWSENGQVLAVIYEKRDIPKLLLYDTRKGKGETLLIPNSLDRITSADFIDNRQMALTAIVAGYSDVFILDTRTRQTRTITRDYHNDKDVVAAQINGRKGLIWASNRPDSLLMRGLDLDTLLPLHTFDLFFYDLQLDNPTELVRLTHTPLANEKSPTALNDRYFAFLSDESGIYNRYLGYIDTVLAYSERVYLLNNGEEIVLPEDSLLHTLPDSTLDTTYIRPVYKPRGFAFANSQLPHHLIQQSATADGARLTTLVYTDGRYSLHQLATDTTARPTLKMTRYMQLQRQQRQQRQQPTPSVTSSPDTPDFSFEDGAPIKPTKPARDTLKPAPKPAADSGKIDIDNYFFQSEFEDDPAPVVEQKPEPKPQQPAVRPQDPLAPYLKPIVNDRPFNRSPIDFKRSRIIPYRTQFHSEFLSTQLDNRMLFGGLVPTVDNNPNNTFPPLGVLTMLNVEDLFEDYSLRLGVRIPVTFDGVEYFAIFDNDRHRLDRRYNLYRAQFSKIQDIPLSSGQSFPVSYKLISNVAQAQFRYPLDIYQSFRATITGRTDSRVYEARNPLALELSNYTEQRIGLKLEYVFDNTLDIDLNIKNGTRIKATAEVLNRFAIGVLDSVYFEPSTGFLGLAGIDARHYQPLDRHSILAVRLAAFSTFGTNKTLFFLGGTNNWMLLPEYNQDIPIPTSDAFVYQTIAANLRGFRSNIRNGSNYALLNAELRVPITKYLTAHTVENNFIRNLQLVGFFDAGTAWEGFSPFRDDNPLNTVVIQDDNAPVRVTVNYFRNPIVMGYGFGARSTLLGYYVRADYAWGIETGIVNDPMLYISIGTDF